MEGAVDYVITIKQHQQWLFHSLIIAEWEGKTEEGRNSRHQAGIEGFKVVRSYSVNERGRSLAYSYEIIPRSSHFR